MDTQNSSQTQEVVLENKDLSPAPHRHPFLRKVILGFTILCFILITVFLVYLNGKSIYANGL